MRRGREVDDGSDRPANSTVRRWNIVAVAMALFTGLGVALLPLGTRSSLDSSGVGTSSRVSLLSNEGSSVLIVVAIPALLIALPLVLRGAKSCYRSRVVIVVLLGVFVMLGALSIGLFFVPTLIAMIASTSAQSTARSAPARGENEG